jgi:hypothetical protein
MDHFRPLTLMLVVPVLALALSACGGGSSDKDQITHISTIVGTTPGALCDHASPRLLAGLGGVKECHNDAINNPQPPLRDFRVNSVTVTGNSASASVTGQPGGTTTEHFVKVNGSWVFSAPGEK